MEIKENEVHTWLIDMDKIINYEDYEVFLNENERLRGKKLLSDKLKKNHIISHFATREILSYYLNIPLIQIPLTDTKFNKPYLRQNPLKIEFNLTHSHDLALLAITKIFRIGIDIERMSPLQDQEDIEKLILSQKEHNWLFKRDDQEKCESFYRLWTAKEALMKGIGEGFHFGIENIDFEMPQYLSGRIGLVIHSHPEESLEWTVLNFKPQEKYMGALATKQPVLSFSQFQWKDSQSIVK